MNTNLSKKDVELAVFSAELDQGKSRDEALAASDEFATSFFKGREEDSTATADEVMEYAETVMSSDDQNSLRQEIKSIFATRQVQMILGIGGCCL